MARLVSVALALSALAFSGIDGAVNRQIPGIWDALDRLRGHLALPSQDIQELFYSVQPGVDFPIYATIPDTGFNCKGVNQAGYYADQEARCQVFRRCDLDNVLTSYLCPNMTLFNQITLTCDWWYNVDCAQAKQFYDYSNTRLYQGEDVTFLDNQDNYSGGDSGAAPVYGSASASSHKSGQRVAVSGAAEANSESGHVDQLSAQDIYNGQGSAQPVVRRKKQKKHRSH